MTSRPAAPESPETDALLMQHLSPRSKWLGLGRESYREAAVRQVGALIEHARSLERRLAAALLDVEGHKAGEGCQHQRAEESERREALAQTEIKGHMRIKDDLERDLGLERESHEVTKRMLSDRDDRIAELEMVEHRGDAPGEVFGW